MCYERNGLSVVNLLVLGCHFVIASFTRFGLCRCQPVPSLCLYTAFRLLASEQDNKYRNFFLNRTEIYAAKNVNWESVLRNAYKILVGKLRNKRRIIFKVKVVICYL